MDKIMQAKDKNVTEWAIVEAREEIRRIHGTQDSSITSVG